MGSAPACYPPWHETRKPARPGSGAVRRHAGLRHQHDILHAGRPGLQLFLSVGNGAPPEGGIVSVRIVEGRREIVTGDDRGGARLANPFVSPRALRFDVTMAGTLLARLDARTTRGPAYRGTLRWRGRASPVRCVWDEDQ